MKRIRGPSTPRHPGLLPRSAPALALGLALLVAGCGSDGSLRTGELDPDAFRARPGTPGAAPAERRPTPTVVARAQAGPAPVDITARVGEPEAGVGATPTGPRDVIDSKIGDINGHPVWASQFFDEYFSGRLRTLAAKSTRQDWETTTRSEIDQRLDTLVMQQLMIDEGLATLTPEMKQFGLQAVLNQWRENQKSRNMGSEIRADRAAREQQNQYYGGLDEQARIFQERLLIRIMKDKLDATINISSADVLRFYEANPEMFNPPPVAVFSMIQVEDDAPADAAAARWALEEGAPFADVASLPINGYKPDEAGRWADKQFTGEYAGAELFGTPEMAAAARPLAPGEWTGPFRDGKGRITFLRLDRIVRNAVSLYDAQMAIEDMLHDDELRVRMEQKVARLKSRSSLTDQSEMSRRLMDFARAKFLPAEADGTRSPR